MKLPFHRMLNYIYAWCVERIDPEKRQEWEYQLTLPLPGQEKKPTESTLEDEAEGFMQLLNSQRGI